MLTNQCVLMGGWAFIMLNTELCADPASFVRGGPTLSCFFFVDEGIFIPLKAGHHQPTNETPFKWRLAGGPILYAGLVAL